MAEQQASKITKPERILSLLQKLSRGRAGVLLRFKEESRTAIRASLIKAEEHELTFGDLSAAAMKKLGQGQKVKVEFVGLSTQLDMQSCLLEAKGPSIWTAAFPQALSTSERRGAQRFKLSQLHCASIRLSSWEGSLEDVAHMPLFTGQQALVPQLRVLDISLSGVCIESHFPAFYFDCETMTEDKAATLLLPMQEIGPLHMEVRWRRKVKMGQSDGSSITCYRMGLQWPTLTDEQRVRLLGFLRLLSRAEAL